MVTNYAHYYVAHSGEQMELHDLPLGYDSQQGEEAAHKDIKHDRGTGTTPRSNAALQIMYRS